MKANNSKGVTIVELVIVLSVMSIATAVSLPRITDYHTRKKLDGAVQLMTFDLLLVRQQAVSKGNNFVVNIYNTENQYLVFDDEDEDRIIDDGEAAWGPKGFPPGVVISESAFLDSKVVFYPNGKATAGQISLSNGDQAYTIKVYLTGAVNNDL